MNGVLFHPFRMHDLTLPNRIVLSPMTRASAGAVGNCGYTKETPRRRLPSDTPT